MLENTFAELWEGSCLKWHVSFPNAFHMFWHISF